jgi:hypothetical protein
VLLGESGAVQLGIGLFADRIEAFPSLRTNDEVHRAGFIFERHKRNSLCRAGTLPMQNKTCDVYELSIESRWERGCQCNAKLVEFISTKCDKMARQGKACGSVVGVDFFERLH